MRATYSASVVLVATMVCFLGYPRYNTSAEDGYESRCGVSGIMVTSPVGIDKGMEEMVFFGAFGIE